MGRGVTRHELLVAGAGAYVALLLNGCGASAGDDGEITYWNGFFVHGPRASSAKAVPMP